MQTLQNGLATVITWHKHIALTIVQVKSDVTDNVINAHRTIDALENDPNLDAAELTEQIATVVRTAHGANVSIVDGAAEWILASKAWTPPANALQDLLDQKTPPPVSIPDTVTNPDTPAVQPSPDLRPNPAHRHPSHQDGRVHANTGHPPVDGGGLQPTPGTPLTPAQPEAMPNPAAQLRRCQAALRAMDRELPWAQRLRQRR